ncbi:MAG: DNA primase family protein, partial [Nocardioides sp.]
MTTAEELVTRHLQVTEEHRGQLRFAERFTRTYGGELLFVHGLGWHTWDGARWDECVDGKEHRAVVALIKASLSEMPTMGQDDRKALLQDVGKVESSAGMNGVLELASTMHPCTLSATALDASPYLINAKSGTVDIEAGTVSRSNSADHLSKVTEAAFDPAATSEEFDRFLEQTQSDPEMRAFLARTLGSALLGVVREHVLLIWYGRGANGKGTLRDAVTHSLGDYAIEVPADLLLQSRHAGNLAPERMRLKGARLAFCSEIAEGAKLDEATMKKLTGGDPVNAKLLYKNPIQFDPSHTLVMLTNHLPKVRGDDPATWRRILAVPFDHVVPEAERDGQLPERLKKTPDAVLAWLWAGWLDYQRNGLNPPSTVVAATRKYQLDSDTISRFLADERVVCEGHGTVGSADLYRAFVTWSKGEGEPTDLTNNAFTDAMETRGYTKKHGMKGKQWSGLSLVPDEDD